MKLSKDDLILKREDDSFLTRVPAKFLFGVGDNDGQHLANILFEKMIEMRGVGLSANQVGVNAQVFVMGTEDGLRRDIFNPEILETIGEDYSFKEGCLSFPGLFLYIKRPKAVRVRYQNGLGEFQEEMFAGLTARIFLHEYDHMQGIVFTKHASKLKLDLANKKREKYLRNYVAKVATAAYLKEKNEQNLARV
jgi:peptide deformylase